MSEPNTRSLQTVTKNKPREHRWYAHEADKELSQSTPVLRALVERRLQSVVCWGQKMFINRSLNAHHCREYRVNCSNQDSKNAHDIIQLIVCWQRQIPWTGVSVTFRLTELFGDVIRSLPTLTNATKQIRSCIFFSFLVRNALVLEP